jgi:hypothetical protein
MNVHGLRGAIMTSLLASLFVCVHASNETNGEQVFRVRKFEDIFLPDYFIEILNNNFKPRYDGSHDVARAMARTKNKDEKTLGNRSVNDLLALNWYSSDCSIEDLVRRKNIVEQSNFESVEGATARYFLNEYCRDVYSAVESRCNKKLELWAFKLEPGEEETLDGFLELSNLLRLVHSKVVREALSEALGKLGIVAICKKVVGRVETIRSQGINLVIEKYKSTRLLQECASKYL